MAGRAAFVIVAAALTAGCFGPERETPVAMKPGQYRIDTGGNGTLFLKNGELEMQRCMSADDLDSLVRDPLGTIAYPWDRCRNVPAAPRGNALSGERVCGPDDRGRPWAHIEFTGSHSDSAFQVEGHASHPGDSPGMTDFRGGDFKITGTKVGDC